MAYCNKRDVSFVDHSVDELLTQSIVTFNAQTNEHETACGPVESMKQTKISLFPEVLKRLSVFHEQTVEQCIGLMLTRLRHDSGWFFNHKEMWCLFDDLVRHICIRFYR